VCEPGTITNIKVGSLLPGSVNSFDFCAITLQEDAASDRALNRAIHAIAIVRMRDCPRTCASVARRTAEGKTTRRSAAASSATSPASSTGSSPGR
jgi:hypothetical protein